MPKASTSTKKSKPVKDEAAQVGAAPADEASTSTKTADDAPSESGATEGDKPDISDDEIDTSSGKVTVEYHNPNLGLTTREFSEEVHGEDYLETAKAFRDKFAGRFV